MDTEWCIASGSCDGTRWEEGSICQKRGQRKEIRLQLESQVPVAASCYWYFSFSCWNVTWLGPRQCSPWSTGDREHQDLWLQSTAADACLEAQFGGSQSCSVRLVAATWRDLTSRNLRSLLKRWHTWHLTESNSTEQICLDPSSTTSGGSGVCSLQGLKLMGPASSAWGQALPVMSNGGWPNMALWDH